MCSGEKTGRLLVVKGILPKLKTIKNIFFHLGLKERKGKTVCAWTRFEVRRKYSSGSTGV